MDKCNEISVFMNIYCTLQSGVKTVLALLGVCDAFEVTI